MRQFTPPRTSNLQLLTATVSQPFSSVSCSLSLNPQISRISLRLMHGHDGSHVWEDGEALLILNLIYSNFYS